MLEEKIDRVIELLEELIAVGTGAAVHGKPTTGKPTTVPAKGKPAGKGSKKAPTLEELKEVAVAISNSKKVKEGKEKVVALIQRFGAEALKELAEEHYTEFMEQLLQIRDEGMDPRESNEEGDG